MANLSRTYRPKNFADITGQSHVTETLRKEVATNTLGHAYLFSGPRGVGKTTAARVFAKALNCEYPQDGEPCNACAPCIAMNEGKCLDVIELDAATHTGVDTVRESIIEHVRFSPLMGKRKIYILDEVHMFSTSSWNALLKTLEEPPLYAFFILATTEWHKVPATIVSRCQRFEFKRVSFEALAGRLRFLAQQEGWSVSDEVIALIVSRADGCVRDAETLLGQLGALGETKIDVELASLVIPPSHVPLAVHLLGLWADQEHAGGLAEAQRLSDEGIPLLPLFDDLLMITRKLLAASGDPKMATILAQGSEDERVLVPLVERFSPAELHDLALLLLERRRDVKAGVDALFALQLVGTVVANRLWNRSSDKDHYDQSGPKVPLPDKVKGEQPIHPPGEEGHMAAAQGESEPMSGGSSAVIDMPDLSTVRAKWNAIIRAVDEKNHSLPFILKISRPEEIRGTTLVIRFQYPFHRDKILAEVKNRRLVEECVRAVLNHAACALEGVVGEDPERKDARNQDMVSNILNAFGGSVVEG